MDAHPDECAQPPGALYEPAVRVPTPYAELIISAAYLRPGEPVLFRLMNRGETTLIAGQPFRVERWDGHDRRQIRCPNRIVFTDEGWLLRPGQHGGTNCGRPAARRRRHRAGTGSSSLPGTNIRAVRAKK